MATVLEPQVPPLRFAPVGTTKGGEPRLSTGPELLFRNNFPIRTALPFVIPTGA
jgi:hypothetical protein